MPNLLKIGIIGCGAIGSSLSKAIVRDFSKEARLVALYDLEIKKSEALARSLSCRAEDLVARSLAEVINKSQLVIEAASARSSWKIARATLSRGRDIMIMSAGGVVGHFRKLSKLAEKYNCRVYFPSGAIAGIDALKALAIGGIKKVILTTRKNPFSFKGVKYIEEKGIRLDKIKKERVLFSGSARQAVKYFPQNINVAAVLSMAGIGQDKTEVKIIASAATKKNIHEIQIYSDAGMIFTRAENILHPSNPKTSYLAVLSAIATLKQILRAVKVGT